MARHRKTEDAAHRVLDMMSTGAQRIAIATNLPLTVVKAAARLIIDSMVEDLAVYRETHVLLIGRITYVRCKSHYALVKPNSSYYAKPTTNPHRPFPKEGVVVLRRGPSKYRFRPVRDLAASVNEPFFAHRAAIIAEHGLDAFPEYKQRFEWFQQVGKLGPTHVNRPGAVFRPAALTRQEAK